MPPAGYRWHGGHWGAFRARRGPTARAGLIARAGLDAGRLETLALGPEVAARRAESRAFARKAGVFGLPSHLVGGELFWGQDSLPFLGEHLLAQRLPA